MKRIIAFISFTLAAGVFFSHSAMAIQIVSEVNFLVKGADYLTWNAGIYDSNNIRTDSFAGFYNDSHAFGIGWDAESGKASFVVNSKDPLSQFVKSWNTGLTGQIPGLINLVARDNTNKFGYEIYLDFLNPQPFLVSGIPDKPGETTTPLYPGSGIKPGDLSDLWLTGSFILLEQDFNNASPGNNLQWEISLTEFAPAVPIPGAVWLLGTGLVGLMVIRRKR